MENSNWVKARAACSVTRAFQQLESAVKADVAERNTLREEGIPLKFDMRSQPRKFAVIREGIAGISTVEFACDDGSSIAVSGHNGLSLRAIVGLNAAGDCVFNVDGVGLQGWQFRMKALDGLFFGD